MKRSARRDTYHEEILAEAEKRQGEMILEPYIKLRRNSAVGKNLYSAYKKLNLKLMKN